MASTALSISASACRIAGAPAARRSAVSLGRVSSVSGQRLMGAIRPSLAHASRATVSARCEADSERSPAPVAPAVALAALMSAAPALAEEAAALPSDPVQLFALVLKYGSLAVFIYSIFGMAQTFFQQYQLTQKAKQESEFFDKSGIGKGAIDKMMDPANDEPGGSPPGM